MRLKSFNVCIDTIIAIMFNLSHQQCTKIIGKTIILICFFMQQNNFDLFFHVFDKKWERGTADDRQGQA